MASASPAFYINGGSVGVKASVSASSTVTCTLNDLTGVRQVEWSIVGTDELSTPASYTLLTSGPLGSVMTTTALTAGTAALVKCRINAGIDPQTEQPSDAMSTTAKFYVLTAQGLEVLCAGETDESSSTAGTHDPINASIRKINSTAAASANAIPWKTSVRVATTGDVALSGGTNIIDGVSMNTGDRLLAWQQTAATENGIYVWVSGIWSRSTDADAATGEVYGGMAVYVQEGTTNAKKIIVCTNTGTVTLGATNLTFAEFNALGSTSFNARGTVASTGLVRAENNTTAVTARNAANSANVNLIGSDGSNNVVVGEDTDAAAIQLRSATGGGVTCYANNVAFLTVLPASITYAPAQAGAGAGAASNVRGQKGAAGSSGGSLEIGGGDPGTSGTGHAGDTIVKLGAIENPGDFKSAKLAFDSNGSTIGSIYYNAGSFMFESVGSQLAVVSAGIAQFASANNTYIDGPTDVRIRTGGSPTEKILADTTGVTLFASAGSYGSGSKVLFVANCSAAPSGSPTGGGILFADSGAGKWKGSSGTVTTFGPAEPHCPECGRDFAHEWSNESSGESLAICAPCMLREMERVGLNVNSFAFVRSLSQ